MVQRTPRGPDRFAAEEQRRRSHPIAAHLLADRGEPVPTVVVLVEQAEPGQRAEQATQERLLGAAHDGEVRARCGTGRELVRDADLHGDPDALGLAERDDQLEQPRARVLNACGVPEVGPGSLTSGDRWSDMIPTCRCGCCT